ncbi:hypothetical protein GUJ93_ZPchr0001g29668 [Zizania palustris]|uniref:Uncharacterized protein n=1 Tax=Zizania palustris TaxID=103762 RepID=A0A8J5S232_ZIZPA|nr:hypothetical protein GUJ93_ZPchr0001g29668 [Zizania palustris]
MIWDAVWSGQQHRSKAKAGENYWACVSTVQMAIRLLLLLELVLYIQPHRLVLELASTLLLTCLLFPDPGDRSGIVELMEEAPELISPRISFSHDGVVVVAAAVGTATPARSSIRLDTLLMSVSSRRVAEPEFDFANAGAAAADVAPADRLFAGGKLLPVPPLPPIIPKPSSCMPQQQPSSSSQRRPGSAWTTTSSSPFKRCCSVNSASTTTPPPPRSSADHSAAASRSFSCPSFPLMRSRSAGSITSAGGGHRQHQYKKVGATSAATISGSTRRAYYYGGSRNGSSGDGHGHVRVSPVINVPSIGTTSIVNFLSYLLCDCGNDKQAAAKNRRGFGVNC